MWNWQLLTGAKKIHKHLPYNVQDAQGLWQQWQKAKLLSTLAFTPGGTFLSVGDRGLHLSTDPSLIPSFPTIGGLPRLCGRRQLHLGTHMHLRGGVPSSLRGLCAQGVLDGHHLGAHFAHHGGTGHLSRSNSRCVQS